MVENKGGSLEGIEVANSADNYPSVLKNPRQPTELAASNRLFLNRSEVNKQINNTWFSRGQLKLPPTIV